LSRGSGLVAFVLVGRAGNKKSPGRYALEAKLEIRPSRLESPGERPPAPPPNNGRAT
jgi:hypothetical protein